MLYVALLTCKWCVFWRFWPPRGWDPAPTGPPLPIGFAQSGNLILEVRENSPPRQGERHVTFITITKPHYNYR